MSHVHNFVYSREEDDHLCVCGAAADDCMFETAAPEANTVDAAGEPGKETK